VKNEIEKGSKRGKSSSTNNPSDLNREKTTPKLAASSEPKYTKVLPESLGGHFQKIPTETNGAFEVRSTTATKVDS